MHRPRKIHYFLLGGNQCCGALAAFLQESLFRTAYSVEDKNSPTYAFQSTFLIDKSITYKDIKILYCYRYRYVLAA